MADVAWDAIFDKGAHEAAYSGFQGPCDGVGLAAWLRTRDVDAVDVLTGDDV